METLFKNKPIDWGRLQTQGNEALIQAVLNWDELQYCGFKFDAGSAYAKRITGNDAIGFDMLIKTRFFWQWWKNEWAKRDADFLLYYSSTANKALLHDQYLFMHSIPRLKSDELMERKACCMVGYCIDEHLKAARKGAVR